MAVQQHSPEVFRNIAALESSLREHHHSTAKLKVTHKLHGTAPDAGCWTGHVVRDYVGHREARMRRRSGHAFGVVLVHNGVAASMSYPCDTYRGAVELLDRLRFDLNYQPDNKLTIARRASLMADVVAANAATRDSWEWSFGELGDQLFTWQSRCVIYRADGTYSWTLCRVGQPLAHIAYAAVLRRRAATVAGIRFVEVHEPHSVRYFANSFDANSFIGHVQRDRAIPIGGRVHNSYDELHEAYTSDRRNETTPGPRPGSPPTAAEAATAALVAPRSRVVLLGDAEAPLQASPQVTSRELRQADSYEFATDMRAVANYWYANGLKCAVSRRVDAVGFAVISCCTDVPHYVCDVIPTWSEVREALIRDTGDHY